MGTTLLNPTLAYSHPFATQQPTAQGKTIQTLKMYQGLLYAGYGDWNNNTGPIHIVSYDPDTMALSDACLFDTEALCRFSVIGSRLWAAAVDPRSGSQEYAYRTSSAPEWTTGATGKNFEHLFDIVTLSASDVWMVGQINSQAAAWRSTDSGSTWQNPLLLPANGDPFARAGFGGIYNSHLFTQCPNTKQASEFNGTSWGTNGTNLLPNGANGSRCTTFAGGFVYSTGPVGYSGRLYAWSGGRVTEPLTTTLKNQSHQIWDVALASPYLYAVLRTGNCKIIRTQNLSSWEIVGELDLSWKISSLEVSAGILWFGTENSTVYKVAVPSDARPALTAKNA